MARGGFRLGSGRPRGSRNILTRKIDDRIATGLTPLEALFDVMRFYDAKAKDLWAQLEAYTMAHPEASRSGAERTREARIFREAIRLSQLACGAAAKAAPYVHPRAGYASEDDFDGEFVPLAERLAYYESRDEIKTADGRVRNRLNGHPRTIGSASLVRNALSPPADPDAMPPYHASELRRRRNSLRTAFDHAHADDFAAAFIAFDPLKMRFVRTTLFLQ